MIDALQRATALTGTTVVGHIPVTDAGAFIANAVDGRVAAPIGDRLVDASGLLDALDERVLLPTDPQWRTLVASASAGVTGSITCAAETGTAAVAAGPGRPRALPLIPPHHFCIVDVASIEPTFGAALARIAPTETQPLPSDLIWISGPSRTGDLEMITTVGIHGPLAVTFVLVEV
jgi:L-lactate dehydrogenase complex protein LldG